MHLKKVLSVLCYLRILPLNRLFLSANSPPNAAHWGENSYASNNIKLFKTQYTFKFD